jgi:hypothetical protein
MIQVHARQNDESILIIRKRKQMREYESEQWQTKPKRGGVNLIWRWTSDFSFNAWSVGRLLLLESDAFAIDLWVGLWIIRRQLINGSVYVQFDLNEISIIQLMSRFIGNSVEMADHSINESVHE